LPSDALCCLVPEIYVTLVAAVIDPLAFVANNSTIVLAPKKYSAHCLTAILNSRISRYYSFLTLRSAILLRRRTHWFPRAIGALPVPELSAPTAKQLHDLAVEAANLSGSVFGNEVDAYAAAIEGIKDFTKAGFLGLEMMNPAETLERDELAEARITSPQVTAGSVTLRAPNTDLLTLARVALLSSEPDEFGVDMIENLPLPADTAVRTQLAKKISNFATDLRKNQQRVGLILEEIDEIVALGLGLTAAEHQVICDRCQEFPLSVTVERPRFVWSPDRKNQARRLYNAGERFK
jgi:hypothetical protein